MWDVLKPGHEKSVLPFCRTALLQINASGGAERNVQLAQMSAVIRQLKRMTTFRVSRHLVKSLWEEGENEKPSNEQVERVAKWCDFDVKSRMRHNKEVPPLETMLLDLIFLEIRMPNETAIPNMNEARELKNCSPELKRQWSNGTRQ